MPACAQTRVSGEPAEIIKGQLEGEVSKTRTTADDYWNFRKEPPAARRGLTAWVEVEFGSTCG
jgi:hypothetical protein